MAPVDFDPDAYIPPDAQMGSPFQAPAPPEPPEPPRSFLSLLGDAFVFPFIGKGTWMIIAGAVFFTITQIIAILSCFGFILTFSVAGYLAAYMFKVVGAVARGDQEPPSWPDITSFYEDIFRPFILVVGTFAFCFAPCIVYLIVLLRTQGWAAMSALEGIPAFVALAVVGLAYLPMALLAVALYDSFAGLSPLLVIRSIVRVTPAYAVACGFLLIAIIVRYVLATLFLWIPVVRLLLDNVVSLYFLMCEMYILGILYRVHEKKLKWFEK